MRPFFWEIGVLLGRFTRQKGIFKHNSTSPLLHALFSRSIMTIPKLLKITPIWEALTRYISLDCHPLESNT
jgi:hypothetical protein